MFAHGIGQPTALGSRRPLDVHGTPRPAEMHPESSISHYFCHRAGPTWRQRLADVLSTSLSRPPDIPSSPPRRPPDAPFDVPPTSVVRPTGTKCAQNQAFHSTFATCCADVAPTPRRQPLVVLSTSSRRPLGVPSTSRGRRGTPWGAKCTRVQRMIKILLDITRSRSNIDTIRLATIYPL